jgi:hypothetical protein
MKSKMNDYSVPDFDVSLSTNGVHGSVILVEQNSIYASVAVSL